MEKTSTLNLQVDTAAMEQAEKILNQLGIPVSTAVNLFFHQVQLTGGIPFHVSLPMVPPEMNADLMTREKIIADIEEGLEEAEAGKCVDAEEAFIKFLESRRGHTRDEAV